MAKHPTSFAMQRTQDRMSPLSYFGHPYLLIYAGFLGVMVALSFAIPGVHSLSMALRWPVLGGVALLGAFLPVFVRSSGWTAPHAMMAVFLMFLGASALYSAEPSYSAQRFISVAMLFFATFVGLFVFTRDWRSVVHVTDLLWCIGASLVLAGVVFRSIGGESGDRYEGLHSRATGAGTYAALFLPIAVYQASYRFKGIWQFFGWGLVLLFVAQAMLAGARAAFVISMLVILALGFAYNARRAAMAAIMAAFFMPVPFFLNQNLMERVKDKAERLVRAESFGTFTGRLDRWVFGIEQWQRKPILGHGFGVSRSLAGQEDPSRFKISPGDVYNLHSDQIEVLMDVGVLGYIPFALFWVSLLMIGWKTIRSANTLQRQLSLAYFGSVFYAFVDTFMHGGFLAAGGGVSAFSWSMIALFLATATGRSLMPAPATMLKSEPQPSAPKVQPRAREPQADIRSSLPSIRRLRMG